MELLRNAVRSAADDDGWSRVNDGAPADRQPGLVRPAQLRLFDPDQAAGRHRPVRAGRRGHAPAFRCARSGPAAARADGRRRWTGRSPGSRPWREPGEPVGGPRRPPACRWHEALNAAGPAPGALRRRRTRCRAGTAYEQFIFETGQCPVRPGPARLLQRPGLAALPARQARAATACRREEIARAGIGGAARPGARRHHGVRRERRAAATRRRRCGRRCWRASGGGCSSSCGRCGRRRGCWSSATRCWSSWPSPRKGADGPCLARAMRSRSGSGRGRLAGRALHRRGAGRQAVHAAAGAGRARLVAGKRELFLL